MGYFLHLILKNAAEIKTTDSLIGEFYPFGCSIIKDEDYAHLTEVICKTPKLNHPFLISFTSEEEKMQKNYFGLVRLSSSLPNDQYKVILEHLLLIGKSLHFDIYDPQLNLYIQNIILDQYINRLISNKIKLSNLLGKSRPEDENNLEPGI